MHEELFLTGPFIQFPSIFFDNSVASKPVILSSVIGFGRGGLGGLGISANAEEVNAMTKNINNNLFIFCVSTLN